MPNSRARSVTDTAGPTSPSASSPCSESACFPQLGQNLFPAFKERAFLMHWVGAPGTSHEETARTATAVSREIRAIPGVRSFGAHTGQALQGEEVYGVNFGDAIPLPTMTTHWPASTRRRIVDPQVCELSRGLKSRHSPQQVQVGGMLPPSCPLRRSIPRASDVSRHGPDLCGPDRGTTRPDS